MSAVGFAPMWRSVADWPLESVLVTFDPDAGLSATGTQLGMKPFSYRADYELETGPDLLTRSLRMQVTGDGFARAIELLRDERGVWTCDVAQEGRPPAGLDEPGLAPGSDLIGTPDCDIELSPLTITLPIRRLGLHEGGGAHDLQVAYVSVPDLRVQVSSRRYEHVAPRRVRYRGAGVQEGSEVELEVDDAGLVIDHPGVAHRVGEAYAAGPDPGRAG